MIKSAIFTGRIRDRALSFPLKLRYDLEGREINKDRGLHITAVAAREVQKIGLIHELLPNGVRLADHDETLPSIQVRVTGTGNTKPVTILLAPQEADEIGAAFDLPPRVMAGAYFRFTNTEKFARDLVKVAPDCPVYEPDWLASLRSWVADPAGHSKPDPDHLPGTTLKGRDIFLPGVPDRVYYPGAQGRSLSGEFRLVSVDGSPRMQFVRERRENDVYTYLLRWAQDSIVAECLRLGSATRTSTDGETYDKVAAAKLLAPLVGPEGLVYCCSKLAGEAGFTFAVQPEFGRSAGPVEKQILVLRKSTKIGLPKGRLYFFDFVRKPDALFVAFYAEAARTKMAGWARYNFDGYGLLRSKAVTVQAPEECPDFLAAKK